MTAFRLTSLLGQASLCDNNPLLGHDKLQSNADFSRGECDAKNFFSAIGH